MASSGQNIQVAVRCRPLNEREKRMNTQKVIECNERKGEIVAYDDRDRSAHNVKTFNFDKVFGITSKQTDVYNQVVRPVVQEVIEGYACTIFAYGQTGTGKTYTMEGSRNVNLESCMDGGVVEDDPQVGIIPRAVGHIFDTLNTMPDSEYSVSVSYLELYNEDIFDLLSGPQNTMPLTIFEDPNRKGCVVLKPELEEIPVMSKNEVYSVLNTGRLKRQTACTNLNEYSSRSHSIFMITVVLKTLEGEETVNRIGKLNLVDLAGSENVERSGVKGKQLAEAGRINKSLITLGRVINALNERADKDNVHIPYRESNLTRLLQDSLGGRAKTTIIATISPAQGNLDETLNTLDYALKAKSIKNKPEVNAKKIGKELIKHYLLEIERLNKELQVTRDRNGRYMTEEDFAKLMARENTQKEELRQKTIRTNHLEQRIQELEQASVENKEIIEEKDNKIRQLEDRLIDIEKQISLKDFLIETRERAESELETQAEKLHNRLKQAKSKLEDRINFNVQNHLLAQHLTNDLTVNIDSIAQLSETMMHQINTQHIAEIESHLSKTSDRLSRAKNQSSQELTKLNKRLAEKTSELTSLIQNDMKSTVELVMKQVLATLKDSQSEFLTECEKLETANQAAMKEGSSRYENVKSKLRALLKSLDEINIEELVDEMCRKILQDNYDIIFGTFWNELDEKLDSHVKSVCAKLDKIKQEKENVIAKFVDSASRFAQMFTADMTKIAAEASNTMGDTILEAKENTQYECDSLSENMKQTFETGYEEFKSKLTETCEQVTKPVAEMLHTQQKHVKDVKSAVSSLNIKFEHSVANSSQWINELKIKSEQETQLADKVKSELTEMQGICQVLDSNLNVLREETENDVKNLFSHAETQMQHSSRLIESDVKNELDAIKDHTTRCSARIQEIGESSKLRMSKFIHEEYKTDHQLNTPKKRKSDELDDYEIKKSKPNSELIQEFLQRMVTNGEFLCQPVSQQSATSPVVLSQAASLNVNIGSAESTGSLTSRLNLTKMSSSSSSIRKLGLDNKENQPKMSKTSSTSSFNRNSIQRK